MYNSQNSRSRKGHGQHDNYECPKCGKKFHFGKKPTMLICSQCNAFISEDELIEITNPPL